ncbi:uncharacterized protein CEXT_252811 [Caerostris extrusa]|uniref:DNA polymerase alpha subunit B N-terminal domain-containing protein n=1 Tax=Caerostris extrusa TaxID=172846 RepID=A0AAV4MT16_CAEEX|nr:uncharacterized protein CEXT_252811 [Caerostris extrusa]
MDINIEQIQEHLEEFCCSADEKVLNKMKELCFAYRCSAEDIVDQWIAFSTSKNCTHQLSLTLLDQMEKEELMKPKIPNRGNLLTLYVLLYTILQLLILLVIILKLIRMT